MYRLIIIIILLFLVHSSNSYELGDIDKLHTKLKKSTNKDSIYSIIEQLHNIKINLVNTGLDFDTAIEKCQKEINIAKQLPYKESLVYVYMNMMGIYIMYNKFEESIRCGHIALDIAEKYRMDAETADILLNIGWLYEKLGEYNKMLKYGMDAMKIINQSKSKSLILGKLTRHCYHTIGHSYFHLGKMDSAEYYFQKALSTDKSPIEYWRLLVLNNNLGLIYIEQGKYDSAITTFQKSLEYITKKSTTKKSSADSSLDDITRLGYVYGKIAMCYYLLKDYDNALNNYYKARDSYYVSKKWAFLVATFNEMANLFKSKGDFKLAQAYYDSALVFSQLEKSKNSLKNTYLEISKFKADIGDYKSAYQYYLLYTNVKDSLAIIEKEERITKMQSDYNLERKEQKIKMQREEIRHQKIMNYTFIGGFSFAIIFAIFIFYSRAKIKYTNQQLIKLNNEISEQKRKIEKQAEELLLTNKKLKELDNFKQGMVEMIVHDLKNPLNSILNVPSTYSKERQIEIIQQSARQMLNLVMNILDVQKYENVKMALDKQLHSVFKVAESAIEEIKFLSMEKNISIKNQISTQYTALLDEEIIRRVFVNLLTNAIKFTPTNGQITIDCEEIKSEESSDNKTQYLKISVTDTGEGIPPDKINMIFDKFGQVIARKSGSARSTGLGLTFCKLAIESHGGEISVNSNVGKGTTFYFTLPGKKESSEFAQIQSDTSVNNEIILTEENKRKLKPYIDKFMATKIYEISTLRKLLKQIDEEENEQVRIWKDNLKNAIYTSNEKRYKEILNL